MKKNLLRKIVMAAGSILALVMVLFVRVSAENTLVLGETKTIRDAGSSSFFKFLSDASEKEMFGLARLFMWVGFIIMVLSVIYFVTLLVLELMGKEKLINKLSLVTKVFKFVIIGGLVIVLLAGLDKEELTMGDVAKETLSITLFGLPFILSLIFAAVPLASDYLIKD